MLMALVKPAVGAPHATQGKSLPFQDPSPAAQPGEAAFWSRSTSCLRGQVQTRGFASADMRISLMHGGLGTLFPSLNPEVAGKRASSAAQGPT